MGEGMTPEQKARWHHVSLPSGIEVLLLPGPWLWDGDRMFQRAAAEIILFQGHFRIRCYNGRGGNVDTRVSALQEAAVNDAETTLLHMGWTLTDRGAVLPPTEGTAQEKSHD